MSAMDLLVFFCALAVPLSMMLVHDFQLSREKGVTVMQLPAFFNRYATVAVLTTIYGGVFYLLLMLFFDGYLDNGQTVSLYGWNDYFIPAASVSTVSILLFGYILQADNAFYLRHLLSGDDSGNDQRRLILRTFRSMSVGQIAPGVLFPLSITLWALHGAWLYNVYNIVIRATNQDLMPRVFFYGALRMVVVLFVSIFVYCVFQAFCKAYQAADSDQGLQVQNRKAALILLGTSFLIGVFPIQAAESAWQKVKYSELFGEFFSPASTLSMEHLQGMNAFMRDRLLEEGIVDIHQLATLGERRDLLHSRINNLISEAQLDDWIDQSRLLLLVADAKTVKALKSIGLRDYGQLKRLLQPENSQDLTALLEAADAENRIRLEQFIRGLKLSRAVDVD